MNFIKIGQHISSLQYLLPEEYVSTFSILYSNAPTSDFNQICAVLKSNLNQEVFFYL